MGPSSPHAFANSNQVWRLIEKDYTLRLSAIANKWATEHLKAWNAVFAEGRKRGNAAYYAPALVEMEIADADKRAEWSYKTCCEIWEIQGRTKCKLFFRAVFDWCLQPMFSTRQGCFRAGLELHQKRTGRAFSQGLSAICRHMSLEMGHLRSKWATKIEIASRDNEYQAAQRQEKAESQRAAMNQVSAVETLAGEERPRSEMLTIEQVHAVALTSTWKQLEHRFREIQAKTLGQRVSTNFIRTEWESGNVTKEWIVSGNLVLGKEFELLASVAARKLGCTRSENVSDYWLDDVLEWMQQVGLDNDKQMAWRAPGRIVVDGASATTDGLYTEKIAELSAMFCMELMTRGTPESAVSLPSELSERDTPPPSESPRTAGRAKDQGQPESRAGRKPIRSPEFVRYAGGLWRKHQGINGRVDQDALKRIAADLDQSAFSKPSDYLEARAAKKLKEHNQKFGNSPKKLSTWTDIATRGRLSLNAMRKLLSRCARTSGN